MSRYGTTGESLKTISEERRERRRNIAPGSEGLVALPPATIEELNVVDGTGVNRSMFVLGLHDPYDPNTVRMVPAPK